MGEKNLLKRNARDEDNVSAFQTSVQKCSRHILELKEALCLDKWKAQAEIPLDTEQFSTSRSKISGKIEPFDSNTRLRPPPEIVVYEDPRKRKKRVPTPVVSIKSGWKVKKEEPSNVHVHNDFNIRKAQHEVQKLAITGMTKLEKEEAKIALAVKLGAKPPKKKFVNYRELMEIKKRQQQEIEDSIILDKSKLPKAHRGGQKRRKDKNDVRSFDSQVGRFRNGVQVIKKNELFRMKAKRKTRTRL